MRYYISALHALYAWADWQYPCFPYLMECNLHLTGTAARCSLAAKLRLVEMRFDSTFTLNRNSGQVCSGLVPEAA